ncbi:MAG: hypothetical protein GY830_04170 [Bacteroidetes bacterium]|nr:hypothetical protein [Bacteroidota bacterium]
MYLLFLVFLYINGCSNNPDQTEKKDKIKTRQSLNTIINPKKPIVKNNPLKPQTNKPGSNTPLSPQNNPLKPQTNKPGSNTPLPPQKNPLKPQTNKPGSNTPLPPQKNPLKPQTNKPGSNTQTQNQNINSNNNNNKLEFDANTKEALRKEYEKLFKLILTNFEKFDKDKILYEQKFFKNLKFDIEAINNKINVSKKKIEIIVWKITSGDSIIEAKDAINLIRKKNIIIKNRLSRIKNPNTDITNLIKYIDNFDNQLEILLNDLNKKKSKEFNLKLKNLYTNEIPEIFTEIDNAIDNGTLFGKALIKKFIDDYEEYSSFQLPHMSKQIADRFEKSLNMSNNKDINNAKILIDNLIRQTNNIKDELQKTPVVYKNNEKVLECTKFVESIFKVFEKIHNELEVKIEKSSIKKGKHNTLKKLKDNDIIKDCYGESFEINGENIKIPRIIAELAFLKNFFCNYTKADAFYKTNQFYDFIIKGGKFEVGKKNKQYLKVDNKDYYALNKEDIEYFNKALGKIIQIEINNSTITLNKTYGAYKEFLSYLIKEIKNKINTSQKPNYGRLQKSLNVIKYIRASIYYYFFQNNNIIKKFCLDILEIESQSGNYKLLYHGGTLEYTKITNPKKNQEIYATSFGSGTFAGFINDPGSSSINGFTTGGASAFMYMLACPNSLIWRIPKEEALNNSLIYINENGNQNIGLGLLGYGEEWHPRTKCPSDKKGMRGLGTSGGSGSIINIDEWGTMFKSDADTQTLEALQEKYQKENMIILKYKDGDKNKYIYDISSFYE